MNLCNIILNEISEQRSINALKRQTLISQIENSEHGEDYLTCKSLIFEIAKNKHNGIDTTEQEKKLSSLKNALYKNLEKSGFDINFLQNPYNCTKCKDKGKTIKGYCSCYYKKLSEHILNNCGLNLNKLPDLNNVKFDFLKDEKIINERKQLVKLLLEFVKKCDDNGKKIMLLCGNVGVGKTHLLHGVVNEGIKNNKFVVYSTAFGLNKDFLKYHCAKLEEKDEILNNYINADILCIDDLGTENILKNVTCEYLFLIINERIIRNKATIITTNLKLSQIIDVYDERIYSRLKDKQNAIVVNLTGDDMW